MNKVGPAIFCFALLCVVMACLMPHFAPALFVVGWAVQILALLAWGVYLLTQRRWSGLFFVLAGAVEFLLVTPAIHSS